MQWNDYFFDMANFVSQKSKDIHTKVGCVIVGENNEVRSTGYNGFPIGVDDSVDHFPERFERPEKYTWTEHAERNAIYLAARNGGTSLENCKIFLNGLPCADCARAIIQSGIKHVIVHTFDFAEIENRKIYRFDATLKMFEEGGIQLFIKNKINEPQSMDEVKKR